jgi:dienelactone hydrolase
MQPHRVRMIPFPSAVVACVVTCTAGVAAQQLDVPATAQIDRPVPVRVTSLTPGAVVALRTVAVDNRGHRWTAHASYRASPLGTIDLERDTPISAGAEDLGPGGLFSGMRAEGDSTRLLRFATREAASVATSVILEDSSGAPLDSAVVVRYFLAPDVRQMPVSDEGLRGHLFLPPNTPAPGVLVLGGSEGGYADEVAALLASNGFTALSLAYFGVGGLPAELGEIPLEYFERAVAWLGEQSAVLDGRVAILGTSKGAEAALLVASRSPAVRGVVAYTPSSVAWYCICSGLPRSSWSLDGKGIVAVPPLRQPPPAAAGPVRPAANYLSRLRGAPVGATILVERIRGPLLLVAGDDDQLWPSFLMARQIMERRASRGGHPSDRLLAYAGAGHLIGKSFLPAGSTRIAGGRIETGGTPAANARAQADAWPKVLQFLKGAEGAEGAKGQRP